ncbi:alanine acetyltransferase [Thioclava dalianensis]|uniref:[Ribosomal protein bS18]-alanine N-acetyltransferase n=1 Tax=Thioclava dalianensis TaxID=1185766 RepID=A0A074TG95_9RHOB|nr:ribosomal protein S18-alanine N-acetyltransferase [Thioclava dalianensis]KEP69150.1 alanine acetyltransferase [Thioclava dalianensis]SFM91154.1 ribosomal-protein-alanine N-acetyltransferase [Thioclava dalianensis]
MGPEDLSRLHAACFTTPRPWSAAEFADFLAQDGVFLVQEPGGFLLGRVIVDEAELLTLAVDPAQRRRGIARRLMAQFVAQCQTRNVCSAFLEVSETNAAARALYVATGWQESGRRRAYYRTPEGVPQDAVVMGLPLGSAAG